MLEHTFAGDDTFASDGQRLNSDGDPFVLRLEQVGLRHLAQVGGKNASQGEMLQQLVPQGIRVPGGFAVTAAAYRYFLASADLEPQLRQVLADLDVTDVRNLQHRGRTVRSLILHTPFPLELQTAISDAYQQMCQEYGAGSNANPPPMEPLTQRSMWRCAPVLRLRICRMPALPDSRRPISTSMGSRQC